MKYIYFLLVPMIIFLSCKPAVNEDVEISNSEISIEEFRSGIEQPEAQLIDARTVEEYREGHIEGARNIDVLNKELFLSEIHSMDTTRPAYVYCKSGGRSKKAVKLLKDHGFSEVYDLKGGYQAWENQ